MTRTVSTLMLLNKSKKLNVVELKNMLKELKALNIMKAAVAFGQLSAISQCLVQLKTN